LAKENPTEEEYLTVGRALDTAFENIGKRTPYSALQIFLVKKVQGEVFW